MGKGCPLPQPTKGLGSVVSSPAGSLLPVPFLPLPFLFRHSISLPSRFHFRFKPFLPPPNPVTGLLGGALQVPPAEPATNAF